MMEEISGWLKQIILIVLFATFVDLLLPQKTMQRYVKVVVSLIVLLAILSPVIQLLRSDFSIPDKLQSSEGHVPDEAAWEPLEQIVQDGERLQTDHQDSLKRLVESRLAQMVKEQVEGDNGVRVKNVTAVVALDADDKPSIQSVDIEIAGSSDKPESPHQAAGMTAMRPVEIKPVEPVHIDHDNNGSAKGAADQTADAAGETAPASAQPTGPQDGLLREIALDVAKAWDVKYDRIHVSYAADSGKS